MNTAKIQAEVGAISHQILSLEAQLTQLKSLRDQRLYLLQVVSDDNRDLGSVQGDSPGDQSEETTGGDVSGSE